MGSAQILQWTLWGTALLAGVAAIVAHIKLRISERFLPPWNELKDLEATINRADVDMVIIGTPIDLSRIIKINKPAQRVRYELQEIGRPTLEDILRAKFGK